MIRASSVQHPCSRSACTDVRNPIGKKIRACTRTVLFLPCGFRAGSVQLRGLARDAGPAAATVTIHLSHEPDAYPGWSGSSQRMATQPGKLPPIASFAEWSGLIRSALVWLGCADPAESMKAAREDDPELGELREVMAAWWEAFGTTAATVREAIEMTTTLKPQADENGDIPQRNVTMALPYPALKDALQKVAGVRGVIDAKRLGMWLAARKGRPIGSQSFKRGDDTRDSTATWMIWSAGK